MKVRLLKRLRRKAQKEYYIIKQPGNLYMIPEYFCETYSDLDEAITKCDKLRRKFIINLLKRVYTDKHKKIY